MANWALPQRVPSQFLVSITIVLAGLRLGRALVGRSHAQELAAMLQFLFAVSIAQESVIANAVESTGENVEEESPDELLRREGHRFLLIVVTIVPPVELHLSVFDIQESMVGNRDSVGIAAQVVHHLLRSGEGRFGVDDPLQVVQRLEITAESLGILKGRERRKEAEFAGVEGLLQIGQEQSAEPAGQHPYGQEESGAARNPTGTVERDPATRNDTMQVGMKKQILSPTVQYREETDLGAQIFGIGSDGGQGLGRGSEQNAVDEIFVLVCNGGDLFGEREDDVKIVGLEDFRFPIFEPFRPRQRLAFGAMSIAAAIVAGLCRTRCASLASKELFMQTSCVPFSALHLPRESSGREIGHAGCNRKGELMDSLLAALDFLFGGIYVDEIMRCL